MIWVEAEKIYEEGGHACSRAEITLPPLPVAVKSGGSIAHFSRAG